jgi:transcriptional regulator GlxA family with amidase domain
MHDFTVLVLPGAFASSVAASLDILGAAASVAPRLKLPPPRWRLVSPAGGLVELGNGMSVPSAPLPRRPSRADRSVWIVPGLGTESLQALGERLALPDARRAAEAIRVHLAGGGSVAASCAAVFLLQACGALAGRRVTTSWWLAPQLQQLEPRCTVAADRMVCVDGPVTTAGAAFAQIDLLLHLLQARFGAPLADLLRRLMLIDARQAQAPYAVPALLSSGNALIGQLTARIEAALPRPPSVATLAREFAMSERTLARHVRAATGLTPLALLQGVRLHRARALIESSKMSIEQVAAAVGYENATALRRLIRRLAGATPSRFRAQVGQAG